MKTVKVFTSIKSWICCLCFVMGTISLSNAQEEKESFFDHLFAYEAIPVLTITADFDTLLNYKRLDNYHPATIQLSNDKNSYQGKVKLRGRFRRMKCDFPPIKLKLDKKQLKAMGLKGHNDYKIVSHCVADDSINEICVAKEKLLYDLYNILSEKSFRTKLIRINYIDINGNRPALKDKIAIIIEDKKQLYKRMDVKECEGCYTMDSMKVDKRYHELVALFQYMIGNEDWSSYVIVKNVKMVKNEKDSLYIPIPYDFDFSGIVSPPYATIDVRHGFFHTKDRAYKGSYNLRYLNGVRKMIIRKEMDIYNYINDYPHLPEHEKKDILAYISSFFFILKENSVIKNKMFLFSPNKE